MAVAKGNFSTPERSRDLIFPASKMFIKSCVSPQMKYPLSVKPRHAPLGNGCESPVCVCSVSGKVRLPLLLYKSIPPKVSFRRTGNGGLRGQGRKGLGEHTPRTQVKLKLYKFKQFIIDYSETPKAG